MASNQYVNKVIVNNQTVIDLTNDTVTPNVLQKGYTAHNKSGELIVGTGSFTNTSDGSEAGPIFNLTAEGHAEQATTTGKNLLPNGPDESSTSSRGVTYTRKDGVMTFNGTATVSGGRTDPFNKTQKVTLDAGTYMFSVEKSGIGAITAFVMRLSDNQIIANSANEPAFTLAEPTEVYVGYNVTNGTAYDLTVKPQIELGSTATSYEPYTGGAPSPSPDYPQEIQVVRGRNLLDRSIVKSNMNLNSANGRPDACSGRYATDVPIPVMPGKYTITFDTTITTIRVMYSVFASGSLVKRVISVISGTTFDVDGDELYIGFYTTSSNVGSEWLPKFIQLERGSEATPYVPYGHVEMEAQGKNLLPNSEHVDLTQSPFSHSTATYGGSSIAIYDGETSIVTYENTKQLQIDCDELIAGETYTLSFDVSRGTYGSTDLYFAYGTDTISSIWRMPRNQWDRMSVTFVARSEQYLYITTYGSIAAYYRNFQLEHGSKATEYEPYYHSTTPIPLPSRGWVGSLPDGTADILTLDGAGRVVWKEKTEEVMLDGSTSPSSASLVTANNDYMYVYWNQYDSLIKNNRPSYCNSFAALTNTEQVTDADSNEGIVVGGDSGHLNQYIRIRILTSRLSATTANAVVTWLSTHPVTVLYPLATPVVEHCGYVNLPDIPVGASISIPELDNLNVEYFIDDSIIKLAQAWYLRSRYEMALDIQYAVDEIDETDTQSQQNVMALNVQYAVNETDEINEADETDTQNQR